jgi:hypothetical protein
MKKVIIIILLGVIFVLIGINLFKRDPEQNLSRVNFTKIQLSALIPSNLQPEDKSVAVLRDSNFEIIIRRGLFSTDPTQTGGDPCGATEQLVNLKKIGLVDGVEIFSNNYTYFAQKLGMHCTSLPIFGRKYPGFDFVSIIYTFTNPSLTDEQKNAYRKTADEIVLSLQDVKE